MENPDLVLQETGSRPTYSRLNYVPSGDTLRRDAISSFKQVYYPSKDRSWGRGLEGGVDRDKSLMTKVSNSERGGVHPHAPPRSATALL